jgi:adenylyl cyclase-associated protein
VKGKVNTVSLDKCKQTGLVFEEVIATCEVVNCNSVQVQCLGNIPTVSIDKTDGCQLFVPQALSRNPDFQVRTP